MKKHFRYGLFFALGAMLALGFVACGDESSSGPSKNEETGIETEVSSSSEKDEAISSSSAKDEVSSSSKKVESSSSTEASSSSTKNKESSSSGKVESSSSKNEVSSSSKNVQLSSSDKPVESSSSKAKSSSSEISSSSVKPAESSSSESSSSVKLEESSSSEECSSSVIETSSSSLVATGVCKTKTEDNCVYGTLYDERDGKTYKTVKIGTQEWMAENLNYEISRISKTSIWSTCYEKSADSCAKYGRYYTWTAAIDSISLYDSLSLQCGCGKICSTIENYKIQGVCPDNWHLPSLKEWQTLLSFVGASKAGKMLKSIYELWGGEDTFGFSVLPSGRVTNTSPDGVDVGDEAYFWSTKDSDYYGVKSLFFYSERENVQTVTSSKDAVVALTVRCIKD